MNKRKETKTGKPKIQLGFAADMLEEITKVPTGIPTLDMRLGGGLPMGRVVVVYGGKGSTKTNGARYRFSKSFTEYGLRCKHYDVERQDDPEWMSAQDLPMDKIVTSPEARFNMVFEAIVDEIDNDAFDAFFIDSLDILLHDAVEKKTVGEDHMTLTARKLSQIVFPKLVSRLADTNKILVILCQARSDVGGSSLDGYSGGNALQHDSSLDLWYRRAGMSSERVKGARFKDGDKQIGFSAAVRIMKSKMYGVTEGAEARYDFYFNKGIDDEASVFEEAWRLGRLDSAGAYYTIKDEKGEQLVTGQGANSVIQQLKDNKPLFQSVIDSLSKEAVEVTSIEDAEADVSEITEEEKSQETKRKATAKKSK
jgi:RecA/RadA recombinase